MPPRLMYPVPAVVAILALANALNAAAQGGQASSSDTIDVFRMPPDAVVATVDGEALTAGYLVQHLQAIPERLRPKSAAELEPLIRRIGIERRFAREAERVGLDKQQPYSTAVSTTRIQLLAKAQLELLRAKISVSDTEAQAWYEEHKPAYRSADIQVAYIRDRATRTAETLRPHTEAEAKDTVARLLAAARTGKPFAGLIDAVSDDHPLVTRKGTFKNFNATDQLPDELKQAIARGKAGEVVGPFAGAEGVFVCRIAGIKEKPFGAVREQVIDAVKDAKLNDWIESQRRTVEIFRPGN